MARWANEPMSDSQITCTNAGGTVVHAHVAPWYLGALRIENLLGAHEEITIRTGSGMLIDIVEIPSEPVDTPLNYYWWEPCRPFYIDLTAPGGTADLVIETTNPNGVDVIPHRAVDAGLTNR